MQITISASKVVQLCIQSFQYIGENLERFCLSDILHFVHLVFSFSSKFDKSIFFDYHSVSVQSIDKNKIILSPIYLFFNGGTERCNDSIH